MGKPLMAAHFHAGFFFATLLLPVPFGGNADAYAAPPFEEPAVFGGPADDTATTNDAECEWRDDDGNWISCEALIAPSSDGPAASEVGSSYPAASPTGRSTTTSLPATPAPTSSPKSPFDALPLASPGATPPLVDVREKWAALKDDETRLRRQGGTTPELLRTRRALQLESLVLNHLEEIALRRMQRCIAEHRLPPVPKVQTQRMTAAGPIPLTVEELAATGPRIEPYPCERVRVVDAALVSTLRRYYDVSRQIHEDTLGWHRRDERSALKKEHEELLQALASDDPLVRHRRVPDWRN